MKNRFRMEIKSVSDDGTFEGLLSPYGNVDGGRDVVEPGAYRKTISERGNTVTLLWQHKTEFPIGTLELDDRKDGLWCKGRLEMELPKAQEAYVCLKKRIIKGLSIGFEVVKDYVENGIRHLKEIRLFEGSIVTFPMNEMAMVTAIKALGGYKGDFNEELDRRQTFSSYYEMQYALADALASIIWADMTKDEKVAMCSKVVEQFSESFTTFFPKYLDAIEEVYGPSENWKDAICPETKQRLMGYVPGRVEISALSAPVAGETTTEEGKAANHEGEPADGHSDKEIGAFIQSMRALIPS